MIRGFPIVTARTCFMSSGSLQGSPPPLPMTRLRSHATTKAIRVRSHRHLCFNRRMELVLLEARDGVEQRAGLLASARALDDLAVPRDDVVEAAKGRVEREARRRVRLARQL